MDGEKRETWQSVFDWTPSGVGMPAGGGDQAVVTEPCPRTQLARSSWLHEQDEDGAFEPESEAPER